MAAISTTISFSDGDQVTSAKLNEIISGTTMSSGAVVSGNGTLVVTAGKLKVGTITSSEMGADSVSTTSLINASVTTDKIADENVTAAKLADDSVETAKIVDGNITAAKLDGAQTGTAPVFGVRAWASFDGSAASPITPDGSGNIGTITRVGNAYTVTFTTALADGDYALTITSTAALQTNGQAYSYPSITSKSTTGFVFSFPGTTVNPSIICFTVVG